MLWRKIMQGLSAGRVQSVATRLIVERERERMEFVAADYWDIVGDVRPASSPRASSRSTACASAGRDIERDGTLRTADTVQVAEETPAAFAEALEGPTFTVRWSRRSRTRAARPHRS